MQRMDRDNECDTIVSLLVWRIWMKRVKTEPMSIDYWKYEFAVKRNTDISIETALLRYLAYRNEGGYVGLSFWAASLLGAQKRSLIHYYSHN